MRRTVPMVIGLLALLTVGNAEAQQRGLILIDRTGSMTVVRATGNTRCKDATTQAKLDIAAYFNEHPTGRVAVWTFSGIAPTDLTGGYVTQSVAMGAVNSLPPEGCTGATPLAESICAAAASLSSTGATSRVLYVNSDGGENNSDGACAGPSDADGLAPWDPGSWQAQAIASVTGNAVVNARFWGAGATPQLLTDVETGGGRTILADSHFFQALSNQTGGTYTFIGDANSSLPGPGPDPGVPAASEAALTGLVLLMVVTGMIAITRRKNAVV